MKTLLIIIGLLTVTNCSPIAKIQKEIILEQRMYQEHVQNIKAEKAIETIVFNELYK